VGIAVAENVERGWREVRLETLVDLSLAMGGVRDEEGLVEEVLHRAVGTLDARAGSVITLAEDGRPALVRAVGIHSPVERLQRVLGPERWKRLVGGEAVLGPSADPAAREVLAAPLVWEGRVLGAVALLDREVRGGAGAFTPEDERFLRSLASLAAAAIWTSRTFAAVERERQLLEEENLRLRELQGSEGFVGESPAIRRVLEVARRVAATDASVMIRGESGVGKERLARLIHRLSPRRSGPFVPLDCTALPESLLEAELFGIEEGVATGVRRRLGKLELASGGTLFLDEVGDLALTLQAKLLRVVQERELERVGGRQRIPLDVRLVTATHRPLEAMVEEGTFRRDLYFRLRVVVIELPPLRRRPTDIPLLARHFLALYGARFGRPELRLSAGALSRLMSHPWPGNVRELENVIQAAVALAPRTVIEADDLPLERPGQEEELPALAPLWEVERRHILRVLEAVGGSRSRAARLLGIDRSTLYRKLRRIASSDAKCNIRQHTDCE